MTTPLHNRKIKQIVFDLGGNTFQCQIENFLFVNNTPDGEKILFSSNKQACDSRKFELYLINTDGAGLEQVTAFDGFTSFPEFSPDGKKLVFVSSWKASGRYEFNIFTANWVR